MVYCRVSNKVRFFIYNIYTINLHYKSKKIYIYIEDITRLREDMNFIFEWQNKILFLPRENKIHIFKPPFNVLFIIYTIRHR